MSWTTWLRQPHGRSMHFQTNHAEAACDERLISLTGRHDAATDLEVTPSRPQRRACGVVVLHELFGLSPHARDVCRRLAGLGHHVIAPDLLAGVRTRGQPDVLPETPEGRDAGFDLFRRLTMADVTRHVEAAIGNLDRARVAVVGLSIGGHLAYRLPDHPALDRAVLLYPGWLDTTDGPLHDGIRPLDQPHPNRRTLIITGDSDPLLPAHTRERITAALRRDNPASQLLTIPDTGHGFLAAHRPTHTQSNADAAWNQVRAWLRD